MIIRRSRDGQPKLNESHNSNNKPRKTQARSKWHTSDRPKTAPVPPIESKRNSNDGRKKVVARIKKRSSVERHCCQKVAAEMQTKGW